MSPIIVPWTQVPDYVGTMQNARRIGLERQRQAASQQEAAQRLKYSYDALAQEKRLEEARQKRMEQSTAAAEQLRQQRENSLEEYRRKEEERRTNTEQDNIKRWQNAAEAQSKHWDNVASGLDKHIESNERMADQREAAAKEREAMREAAAERKEKRTQLEKEKIEWQSKFQYGTSEDKAYAEAMLGQLDKEMQELDKKDVPAAPVMPTPAFMLSAQSPLNGISAEAALQAPGPLSLAPSSPVRPVTPPESVSPGDALRQAPAPAASPLVTNAPAPRSSARTAPTPVPSADKRPVGFTTTTATGTFKWNGAEWDKVESQEESEKRLDQAEGAQQ